MSDKPRLLFHCTTEKKARMYRETGHIKAPVRGFTTLPAALAWCVKTGRRVIYSLTTPHDDITHKLPDHHNAFGEAWWVDSDIDVSRLSCVFSADVDA